jgi:hypothetical protein
VEVVREELAQTAPAPRIDWAWLAAPENHLGQALTWVDQTERVLRAAGNEIAERAAASGS